MITRPDHLLTLAEWEAPPEDNSRHFELQEGVLVVEPEFPATVIAPGSRAVDTLAKPADYAEAGIPYYWVVDLDNEPSLTAYHRAEDRRYQKEPAVTARFETTEPFSVRIELTGRDYQ